MDDSWLADQVIRVPDVPADIFTVFSQSKHKSSDSDLKQTKIAGEGRNRDWLYTHKTLPRSGETVAHKFEDCTK